MIIKQYSSMYAVCLAFQSGREGVPICVRPTKEQARQVCREMDYMSGMRPTKNYHHFVKEVTIY